MKHSNDIRNVYKSNRYHNPWKERKFLIVFDDLIADMISNTNFFPAFTKLFIKGMK